MQIQFNPCNFILILFVGALLLQLLHSSKSSEIKWTRYGWRFDQIEKIWRKKTVRRMYMPANELLQSYINLTMANMTSSIWNAHLNSLMIRQLCVCVCEYGANEKWLELIPLQFVKVISIKARHRIPEACTCW